MDLNVLVFGWLESADIRRRYRNSKVTKFHFFEILWPTFTQFRPCMCHHLPRITVTSTEAKALRKISRPKFIAYGFADMASRRNLLKFQFLGNRERITELSGPLCAAHLAVPQWLAKSGFGDQIRVPDPPESKFRIFDLPATSCTLVYIFSCILTEDIMPHDV